MYLFIWSFVCTSKIWRTQAAAGHNAFFIFLLDDDPGRDAGASDRFPEADLVVVACAEAGAAFNEIFCWLSGSAWKRGSATELAVFRNTPCTQAQREEGRGLIDVSFSRQRIEEKHMKDGECVAQKAKALIAAHSTYNLQPPSPARLPTSWVCAPPLGTARRGCCLPLAVGSAHCVLL